MPRTRSSRVTDPEMERLVGNRVRQRRLMCGLSQTEVGDRVGVTYQQMHKYERGVNRISVTCLLRLAEALGCTAADLLPDGGATVPPDARERLLLEMVNAWRNISDDDIQVATANFVRAVARRLRTADDRVAVAA